MQSPLTTLREDLIETVKADDTPVSLLNYDFRRVAKSLEKVDRKYRQEFVKSDYQKNKSLLKIRENPRSLFAQGEVYFIKGFYGKAREFYEKTIKSDRNFFVAYQRLIFICLTDRNPKQAEVYHKSLVQVTNRRSDFLHDYILFRLGFFSFDGSVIDECLADAKEILKSEPKNVPVLNTLGFILLNFAGQPKEAEEAFKKVLLLDDKFFHTVNNLGVCELKRGNHQEAIRLFENAIEISPAFPPAYENIASSYIQQNNVVKAWNILQTALDAAVPISDNWHHMYGWLLLQTAQYDSAERWYIDRIKREPDNNLLYNNLGHCYIKLRNLTQAEFNFKIAIKIVKSKLKTKKQRENFDLRSLKAFYNLGRLFADQGKKNDLAQICNDIFTIHPEDDYGHYLYGVHELLRGEFESAQKSFEEALQRNEYIADVYADLSFIYVSITKEYKKAIDLLNKALDLGIQYPLVFNNLLVAEIKAGNLEQAAILSKKIKEPYTPELSATLGLLAFRQGDFKKGTALYETAIGTMRSKLKDVAQQLLLYEQALFLYKSQETQTALQLLIKAKKLGKTYVLRDIEALEEKIKSHKN